MRFCLLLAACALLVGCPSKTPIYTDYHPKVQNIHFPAAIRPGDALTVTLEVWTGGGCDSFDRFEASRSTQELNVEPIGRTLDMKANEAQGIEVACATLSSQWQAVSYVDSGATPRSSPFRVLVNGKLYGEVKVQ